MRRRGDRRRKHAPLAILLVFVAIAIAGWLLMPGALQGYARWLIVEDSFERCDAATVLAGGAGERLSAAIQIYKRGEASAILITGPDVPFIPVYTDGDSLSQGEAKRRIAVRRGVPADSIVLSLGPTSTLEEAQRTLLVAREQGWRSVVIVTSPFHTRRTRATFRKIFEESGIEVAVYHLPIGRSSDNPERWWKREHDTMGVLTETIKLGFYAWNHRISPWG